MNNLGLPPEILDHTDPRDERRAAFMASNRRQDHASRGNADTLSEKGSPKAIESLSHLAVHADDLATIPVASRRSQLTVATNLFLKTAGFDNNGVPLWMEEGGEDEEAFVAAYPRERSFDWAFSNVEDFGREQQARLDGSDTWRADADRVYNGAQNPDDDQRDYVAGVNFRDCP